MWVPHGPIVRTHALPVLDDTLTFEPNTLGLSRPSQLRWRVVVTDGHDTAASPWWQIGCGAGEDRNEPRSDHSLDASKGSEPARGTRADEAAGQNSTDADSRLDLTGGDGRRPLAVHAGMRMHLALPGSDRSIEIYDVRGRRLLQSTLAGDGTWTWTGRDARGARIAPGMYWIRIGAGSQRLHQKILWTGR
jgi:hypothetical protein